MEGTFLTTQVSSVADTGNTVIVNSQTPCQPHLRHCTSCLDKLPNSQSVRK